MKKIKYLAIGALVALSLTSCDKDTEGLTDVLYYPVITVDGPRTVLLNVGDTYVDPGYSAELNGEDYTGNIQVTSNVDTKNPGFYTVTYSVANPEGFSAVESREVWVINPGHFDNLYWAECWHKTNAARHYYNSPVSIVKYDASQGLYLINDVLAGYYAYGIYPQYRNSYDFYAEAILQLDGTNVDMLAEGDWYFADPSDPEVMYDGTWDPETGVITYRLNYYVGGGVVLTPMTEENFATGV